MRQEGERAVELLRPLRRIQIHTTDDGSATAERHEQIVAALEELVLAVPAVQRKSRHSLTLVSAGVATLAAAAGFALWFGQARPGTPSREARDARPAYRLIDASGQVFVHRKAGSTMPGQAGHALDLEDEVIGEAGAVASLVLANGAQVRLHGSSQLALGSSSASAGDESLKLKRGTVKLTVPKLKPGRQLSVVTPQASVIVVGTRFWVTVLPASADHAERTCVGVDEGRVRVLSGQTERLLSAGGGWSSDGLACEERIGSEAAPEGQATTGQDVTALPLQPNQEPPDDRDERSRVSGALPAQSAGAARATAKASPRNYGESTAERKPERVSGDLPPPTAAFEESSLEEQNQLFSAAVAARHASRPAQAVTLLTSLLRRFPDSPLAPAAARELNKAQSELDAKVMAPR